MRPISASILLLLCQLAGGGFVAAQDTAPRPAPGHSLHGPNFSEGPRRHGPLLPGMGAVSFPVTTSQAEVQSWFNQGVAQLHGFWFWEAERSFRTVLKLDPACAMAHWGLAMSCLENEARARAFIAKATGAALDVITPREKQWIEATRKYLEPHKSGDETKKATRQFISDLENIAMDSPEDLEARAFVLGLQWKKKTDLGLENTSYFGMDTIGQDILRRNPLHPAHHYLIHLWDGDKTVRALQAAAMCGPAAPGIAHMWHMPAHIYSGLHRWEDAAWQQEAAARVDHAQMLRSHTMPDQIHNFAHNSEWLIRNLNNLGHVDEALTVAANLISMPRIPRSDKVSDHPDQKLKDSKGAWEHGTGRLRDTLLMWERWDLALAWEETPWLERGEDFTDPWKRTQLLALAAYRTGDIARGGRMLAEFEEHLTDTRADRAAAVDAADRKARDEKKDANAIQQAMAEALKPFTAKLDDLEPSLTELRILADLNEGRTAEARTKLAALKGVHDQRMIALHMELTNYDQAAALATSYAGRSDNQVQPQAILTWVLWRAGRQDEALKAFAALRPPAGRADLHTPLLARLDPVAEAAGVPGDWRQPAAPAPDLGPRPGLESLGPLRWQGWMAPEWTATGPDGSVQGHAALAGKPYLALFVLGGSCAHCNEQLKAFGAKSAAFAAARLPVVVVTTDPAGDLVPNSPWPTWSGSDGLPFKAMDAWDDFENQPLHSTVLVDASGRIRWQHSGYEPFMRPDFILAESSRLFETTEEPGLLRPGQTAAVAPGRQ